MSERLIVVNVHQQVRAGLGDTKARPSVNMVAVPACQTTGAAGAARAATSCAPAQHPGKVVLTQALHSVCIGVQPWPVVVVVVRVHWTVLGRGVRVVALISGPSWVLPVELAAERRWVSFIIGEAAAVVLEVVDLTKFTRVDADQNVGKLFFFVTDVAPK